jgi:hypothetical protein
MVLCNQHRLHLSIPCRSRIIWLSAANAASGYATDFASIAMHAVATDPETVESPCLYVQLDLGDGEGDDRDEDEEGDDDPVQEFSLIPADGADLEALFTAFCEGAERNPDPGAAEESEGSFFFDQDSVLAGATAAMLSAEDVDEVRHLHRFFFDVVVATR